MVEVMDLAWHYESQPQALLPSWFLWLPSTVSQKSIVNTTKMSQKDSSVRPVAGMHI